ncbi:hypothetical protein [Microtetraspora malaysiensis]|uniref:Uncharacterized protein n=1 Tax=Microtetraspora malaysiensis TaxID=161358 RepID=A0ABW6T2G9_9ACTN
MFESGTLSPWTCQNGSAVAGSPVHSGAYALRVSPSASQSGECTQSVTLVTVYVNGWYGQGDVYADDFSAT